MNQKVGIQVEQWCISIWLDFNLYSFPKERNERQLPLIEGRSYCLTHLDPGTLSPVCWILSAACVAPTHSMKCIWLDFWALMTHMWDYVFIHNGIQCVHLTGEILHLIKKQSSFAYNNSCLLFHSSLFLLSNNSFTHPSINLFNIYYSPSMYVLGLKGEYEISVQI